MALDEARFICAPSVMAAEMKIWHTMLRMALGGKDVTLYDTQYARQDGSV